MRALIVLLLFFVSFLASAQTDTIIEKSKKESKMKISEVNIFTGRLYFGNIVDDFANLKKTAHDQSKIHDVSNYDKTTEYGSIYSYGINIALSPYKETDDTYNHYRKLVFGLSFKNGNRRIYNLENESYTNIGNIEDATGVIDEVYQKDSTFRSAYTYREGIQEVTINSAYLFYTNPRYRFSLHTGLGGNIGFSLNSSIIEKTIVDTTLSIYNATEGRFYLDNDDPVEHEYEYIDSKGSMFVRLYIPVGFNVRLSKDYDVLNQLTFFVQGSFGMEYQNIYNTKQYFRTYWGTEIGLRHFF